VSNYLLDSFFFFGELPANIEKGTYSPFLALAAFVVAVLGSYTGLSIAGLISSAQTTLKKHVLSLLSAFAYGSGFWSMHFVGMLGYKTSFEVFYDPLVILFPLLISIAIVYAAILMTRFVQNPPFLRLAFGSFFLGFGICAMHYLGLESLQMKASLRFVPALFFLSFFVAFLGSGGAIGIIFTLGRKKPVLAHILSALVLATGICGAYYISMEAAVFIPFPDSVGNLNQSHEFLAITILAITTILLFILTAAISNRAFVTIGCAALFALPLVLITHQAISGLNLEIQNIKREQFEIAYHKELFSLLQRLEDVRDLSFAIHNGKTGFSDQLLSKTEEMQTSFKKVGTFDLPSFESKVIDKDWQNVRADVLSLQDAQHAASPAAEFEQYARVLRSLITLMDDVADRINLSTDPQTGKNRLLDYSIHVLPQIQEQLSLLRSKASNLISEGGNVAQISEEDKVALRTLLHVLDAQNAEMKNILSRTENFKSTPPRLFDYYKESVEPLWIKLSESVKSVLLANTSAQTSAEMYSRITELSQSFHLLYDEPLTAFGTLLKERKSDRTFTHNLMLYSSLIAFVGFVSLFFFLNRSLVKTERAQKIALQTQGELAVRLIEKERLERQMQDYTDRLELSRFDVMAINAKLKEEEAKIHAVMENVLEGIVVLNDLGIIQSFNKASEHVFGYAAADVIGRSISVLVPSDKESEPETRLRHYIETKEEGFIGVERETVGQRKDGSQFPMVETTSEVILGKARLFISLVRDITVQKEKEKDLLQMKERAEAANQIKSEFLANMSHELRTPLNSVSGMTRLLLGTKLTPEQQELAETVILSSNNLMEIVNDILDLSKIEAGEVVLENIGFDPRQILHSVVRALAHAARERHLPIVRLYENETLPFLMGDPLRIGRIVTNLLSNAIKYTEEGHVEIRAYTKKLDKKRVELHCEVTDTGVGIPKNKLQSVFDKFVQADSSTTRKYGGTGLGLAITRELVLLMGGKIDVTSEVGQGSTFSVSIPFEVADKLHEETSSRRDKTQLGIVPPKNARVLVAEDHPMNQLLIKRLLNKFGIGYFEIANNGIEAQEAYQQKSPWTVILMDCHMPEKNGYDTTIEIREMEKSKNTHVPIVAMTANAMVGDKEKCLHCGMDEYVSKPIIIEELKEVLGQWISFDSSESTEKTGEPMPDETPPVDLTMLRTLTGGDQEIEKELMKTFVVQSDKNLETLKEFGATEGENKPWTEASHMLKGGSGSIGAEELRQLSSTAQLYKGDSAGRLALLEKIDKEYTRVKEHLKKEGLLS